MDETKLVRAFIEENGRLEVDEEKLVRAFLDVWIEECGPLGMDEHKLVRAFFKHGWLGDALCGSVVYRIIGEAIEQAWKESIPSKKEILKAISQGTKQAIGEAEGNSISSADIEEAYQRWRGMGNG